MGRKLLKTVQTITTFRNRLADPVGTRRGPPLVRGPQFETADVIRFLLTLVGNESVPIQLAQCRFPVLAISNIFQKYTEAILSKSALGNCYGLKIRKC